MKIISAGYKSNHALSKVIYATTTSILVYLYLMAYVRHLGAQALRNAEIANTAIVAQWELASVFICYTIISLLAVATFRPIKSILLWDGVNHRNYGRLWLVIIGVTGGLAASILASILPVASVHSGVGTAAIEIAEILSSANSTLLTLPVAMVLLCAMAVGTELLFRGIVFRTVAESASIPSAIITSCLLCSLMWPIYNPIAGVLLGIISALLFCYTGRILSSVVANVIFTSTGLGLSTLMHKML